MERQCGMAQLMAAAATTTATIAKRGLPLVRKTCGHSYT